MNSFIVIVATFLAVTSAMPYDLADDNEGRQYYLIPVARDRREIKWNVKDPGVVSVAGFSDPRYINGDHKFQGALTASKNLAQPHSPIIPGGRIDYTHTPTGNAFGVQAQNLGKMGTQVGLEGKYNLYKNGPLSVDLTGDWTRRYGGQFGTGKPSVNTFLNANVGF